MISETTGIAESVDVEEPMAADGAPMIEEDVTEDGMAEEDVAEFDGAGEADDEADDEGEESDAEEEDDPEDEWAGEIEPGASDFDNLRLVEALLFASAEPLAPAQLARFLPEETEVEPLLADLESLYANRGVNLVKRGGRWAFRTAADLAPRMEIEQKVVRKLSRVALETLSVIAYHQPVTRAEIEEIRGVALSKGTLDALLEIGWIRPKGRRKTPGRPVTWATSEAFLDHFGLEGLDALPGVEELKAAGLLDTRPALTALSDRGLLPSAGEVSPEEVDDEDDDDESEGNERELLDETFGEDLLPREVTSAAEASAETSGEAEEDDEDAAEAVGAEDHGPGLAEDDDAHDDADDDAEDDADDAFKRSLG